MICDNCIHDGVCGLEGHLDEALTFCADKVTNVQPVRHVLTADKREKLFICTCCDCRWIADPSEYVTIRTPMKPNVYCWCPNCGNQTWEQED